MLSLARPIKASIVLCAVAPGANAFASDDHTADMPVLLCDIMLADSSNFGSVAARAVEGPAWPTASFCVGNGAAVVDIVGALLNFTALAPLPLVAPLLN